MPKATVVYYTGTGNTARAAVLLRDGLCEKGYETDTIRVRRKTKPPASCGDLLVVLFPVFAFTIPQSLRVFLNRLPAGNGTRAAIIANHGMLSARGGIDTGHESQSPLVVRRILRKKKYDVTYIDATGYPENFTIIGDSISEKDEGEVLSNGDAKMRAIARNVAAGKEFSKTYGFWNRLGGWLVGAMFTFLGRWHFGKLYVADSACSGCGLCEKGCSSGTLRIVRGRPEWGYRCDGCLFCFNACPKGSVQVSVTRLVLLTIAEVLPVFLAASFGGSIVTALFGAKAAALIAGSPILSFASGLAMVAFLVVPLVYLTDKLLAAAERIKALQPIMSVTYSRNIKRYVCPGFRQEQD